MKTLPLSLLLPCCIIVGCFQPTNDDNLEPAPTIDERSFKISADVEHAVLDHPVRITTVCMPLVTGKGFIGISGWKIDSTFEWVLLSPVADTATVIESGHFTTYVPAEFKINQFFRQEWTLQLQPEPGNSHSNYTIIGAHIYIDSIFIADSNRMYSISSDVARKHAGKPMGWNPYAIPPNKLYF